MKLGVCISVKSKENIALAASLGYDYIETAFAQLANLSEQEFFDALQTLARTGIPCRAANCMLPGDVSVYEPLTAEKAEKLELCFERAAALGIQLVVLGSGRARLRPDSISPEEGIARLATFISEELLPLARRTGISIAVETLSKHETNCVNTLAEGAGLIRAVGCPDVGLLADIFHMTNAGESADAPSLYPGLILHGHISDPCENDRLFPAAAGAGRSRTFLRALASAGCKSCSIEAATDDFSADAAASLPLLRELTSDLS